MPTLRESDTRRDLIDPALKRAGWNLDDPNQVRLEIPVDGTDPLAWERLKLQLQAIHNADGIPDVHLPKGISDYALYQPNGEIIAVVEAKKTSIDPRLAQTQAEFYVTEIEKRQSFRPFAFMTNGREIYFLDSGHANKRLVSGFFSPKDLENLLFIRQHQEPLSEAPINTSITDRAYQQEAIRRVCEAFDQNKRKALLVMATGTGKTRTVMSLIDLFFRTHQALNVLFVADRDPLVTQAINDGFKKHLPDEPHTRIYTHSIKTENRLYAATLQTLNICYSQFTPGFFDLIIFDEVHRSIFNKWNEVLQYFDARMIGLTATPADFLDRNTFLSFGCEDGVPTFLYTYKQAVDDKYLVDYALYKARTSFQRRGIKGVDLSEETRNALIEQGIDPDELDFQGTDLERKVTNRDTMRDQWAEIMDVCLKDRSGQLPGKTIVFAMTQDHALRLQEVFEEMYPQYPGLCRTITYKSDYKDTLIESFKRDDFPRIAISVDLLETGIDVPEVVNLVVMKPVHSRIKLEQMIGRGTRSHAACTFYDRLPDGVKREFLIIDFWENDFNKPAEEEISQSLPVLVTIFNTRLKLLALYPPTDSSPERAALIKALRFQIAAIPLDAFSVKQAYPDIQQVWEDSFWFFITPSKLDFLKLKVGPWLRLVPGTDVEAATFTSKVERLKLAIQTNKNIESVTQSIAEDVSRLPDFVMQRPEAAPLIKLCLSPDLQSATPAQLDTVIATLGPDMKNRRDKDNPFLSLDLPDFIEMRGYILLKGGTERIYVEDYRKSVDQHVLGLVETDPTIEAISMGQEVTDYDLISLERTLRQTLGAGDIELSESNVRKAYGLKVGSLIEFLRHLLGLESIPDYSDIVRRQFALYRESHSFNGDQLRFLGVLENTFVQRRHVSLPDLYDSPFTGFGKDAVERWFSKDQISDILAFTNTLAIAA